MLTDLAGKAKAEGYAEATRRGLVPPIATRERMTKRAAGIARRSSRLAGAVANRP